ncbi:phage tail protein [Bacillus sp. JJ1474]|uniref:phage tail protein n=1 Tax=Bacillus sp. JJ1474 TaxID=3122955 RepID=UPI002FFF78A3
MPNKTTNFNLLKPGQDEFYNVNDQNTNMDTIDGILKALQDAINSGATEQELAQIRQDLATHLAEKATLLKSGHVQLTNNIDSTDEGVAATPKAVKAAMDEAKKMLPLTGGTMTGDIHINNNKGIFGKTTGGALKYVVGLQMDNSIRLGTKDMPLRLQSVDDIVINDLHGILTTGNMTSMGVTKSAEGDFIGDGTNSRFINVGFTPKLVVITSNRDAHAHGRTIRMFWGFQFGGALLGNYSGTSVRLANYSQGGITNNGFVTHSDGNNGDSNNTKDMPQKWVALG